MLNFKSIDKIKQPSFKLLIVFISLFFSTAAHTDTEAYEQSVRDLILEDKELERCLLDRKKIGLSNVLELQKLRCHAYNIQSLSGISALRELNTVVIIGSDIRDITPLSRIDTLEVIYLKGGNENIINISSLTNLRLLHKIHFPNMLESYCYEANEVLKSMDENIDGPTVNNLNLVSCKGKETALVKRAIRKDKKGESLTLEERDALIDYEINLSWSN